MGSHQRLKMNTQYVWSISFDFFFQNKDICHFLLTNLSQSDSGTQRFIWKCNLDAIINCLGDLKDFPVDSSSQYEGPTLFIGGSESDYLS